MQLIDWIINVLSAYNCKERTFFLTVNIIDRYLKSASKSYKSEDIHLIGVTAMYMAMKYEEIYPISLNKVVGKICFDQLSHDDIRNKEIQIFSSLNYSITGPNHYDLLLTAFNIAKSNDFLTNEAKNKQFNDLSFYMLKLMIHQYQLVASLNTKELVCGT